MTQPTRACQARPGYTRFLCASLLAMLALAVSPDAWAGDALKARVGVLRLSSSAPVFIAQDKGYFREAGLDIELKFFDAAQPIAVATASGDIDFGITAFTAGLYNLAGKGTLKVIGGMSREKAGYPLIGYFASNKAYTGGLKAPKDLAGKRIAVTQIGSSFHYSLGLLADKYVSTDYDGKVSNRTESLADEKATKHTSVAVEDLHVTVFGDAAVATLAYKAKGTDAEGKAIDSNARWTATWVKMPNGKWQRVASHGSRLKM